MPDVNGHVKAAPSDEVSVGKSKGLVEPLLDNQAPVPTTSTMYESSFNLMKNLVGTGVLGLSAGIAGISDQRSVLGPACIIISCMALLCAYSFSLLGQLSSLTKSGGGSSIGECWSLTLGEQTSWIPYGAVGVKTFMGVWAFSMILADAFTSIFGSAALVCGAFRYVANRTAALWVITLLFLLPLCLQRSFKALAKFSFLGFTGMIYIAVFAGIRYLDGSYAEGGRYFDSIPVEAQPSFDTRLVNPYGALILTSIGSYAFIAHYNAPKFYSELKDRSTARFNLFVAWSFCLSLALTLLIAIFGFLTFGGASNGMMLKNYSVEDPLAFVANLFVSFSVICSYPLLFTPFRETVLEVVLRNQPLRQEPLQWPQHAIWTVRLLFLVTVLAQVFTDLNFMMSFTGALLGAWVCYIMPAHMTLAARRKQLLPQLRLEGCANLLLLWIGVFLLFLGTSISVWTEVQRVNHV